MRQLVLIALQNLRQQRKRSLLLGGAVALVTAFLVVLLGVASALRESMIETASALMTGHVNVGGFYKISPSRATPVVTKFGPILEIVRRDVPELDYAVERVRGEPLKVISDTSSIEVGITGIDIANEPGFRETVRVIEGNLDALTGKTILLFEKQARRLGVKVGDPVTVSTNTIRGARNTIDLTVGAIAKDTGLLSSLNVFISSTTLRTLLLLDAEHTGVLQLYLNDMDDIPAVQQRLRQSLSAAGYRLLDPDPRVFFMKFDDVVRGDWTGQKLDLTNWAEEMSFVTWILSTVDALVVVLTAILAVIIVIGIMNTMWIAIRERTREIGTLRAIGMQRGRILYMFLFEALLLGLLGSFAGAVIGFLIGGVLNLVPIPLPAAAAESTMSDTLRLSIHLRTVLTAMLAISAVCGIAALFPAYRATKLKPITAMQHAGGIG